MIAGEAASVLAGEAVVAAGAVVGAGAAAGAAVVAGDAAGAAAGGGAVVAGAAVAASFGSVNWPNRSQWLRMQLTGEWDTLGVHELFGSSNLVVQGSAGQAASLCDAIANAEHEVLPRMAGTVLVFGLASQTGGIRKDADCTTFL